MPIRPNHKARQARAGRANIDIPSIADIFRKFKWFTIGLIVIFPVYPSLSVLGSGGTVRAGDYDESTIITAYNDYESDEENYISDTGLIRIGGEGDTVDPGTLTPDKTPETTPANKQQIKKHTVKSRESIRSISDKYGVSTDAIIWANDLSPDDELKIGQVLKVPPVSGVIHKVVSGDTISEIARKYSVSGSDIVSVNTLRDSASIRIGMELMIPGAIRKTPAVTAKTETSSTKASLAKVATKTKDSADAKIAPKESTTISPKTGLKDRYTVKYTGKSRGFVGGNCTWYVAQNKTVTWRGNANAWMRNARAEGVKTGSTPVPGSIVQFTGAGYNRTYGHVGIVADVEDGYIIVKDMNYRGLYEVTIRKVPVDHPSIDGYIYVD